MDFQMKELYPGIYHLEFGTKWQTGMHFIRFQEFYESIEYADKMFTLVDYMEWYQKAHGDSNHFSYPNDWLGFNVPSWVLDQVFGEGIDDWNKYDYFMKAIYDTIKSEKEVFYLIGTSTETTNEEDGDKDVLDHEIAHGFWATVPEYRKAMEKLLKEIKPKKAKAEAIQALMDMSYHERTGEDEVHAHCSTGAGEDLEGILTPKICKPFEKEFRKWKNKLSEKKDT